MFLMESAQAIGSSPFFAWMLELLRAIAAIRTPILTAIMSGVTYLGHEMVFLVLAMILAWCVDKKYGYRYLAIFMVGSFLQQALKAACMIPRPWILDPTFRELVVESAIKAASGYSFPSGHTLTAFVALGGFAMYLKKKWAYAAAVVLTLVVAFSRMYLGVHTLLDVAVGFLLGGLVLLGFGLAFRGNKDHRKLLDAILIIGTALCIGLLLCLQFGPKPADPAYLPMAEESIDNAYVLVGASVGMLLGKACDDLFVHFDTKAPFWMQLIKIALGFGLVLGMRAGLKALFGGENEPALLHGVRYCVMTFVAIGIYPLFFRLLTKKKTAA